MFRLPESRRPVPPGEILFHDWLEPLGFTKKSAAERLGISRPRMSELVAGKRALSSDTAMRFGVNYPRGPFDWRESVGADLCDQLLNALNRTVQDDRFRAPARTA